MILATGEDYQEPEVPKIVQDVTDMEKEFTLFLE